MSNSLGSAAFIATASVAALVGASLSSDFWAGLPSAGFGVGTAIAAYVWSVAMARIGRRQALSLGTSLGVVGATIAGVAIVQASLLWLLVGLVLVGSAQAALNLGRFVAAEVNPVKRRGRAVALVVMGGTVGSVLGPSLIGVMGRLAQRFNLPELSGMYALCAVLLLFATVVLAVFLRPNPENYVVLESTTQVDEGRPLGEILRHPTVLTAIVAMVLGQAVMVMLMVITSLHMEDHNHSLDAIGVVISAHTFGMFAVSLLTGQLLDRLGRAPVIVTGSSILLLAALSAPLSMHILPLAVSLFLLGLGWNFCFVGGSALLADSLLPSERPRVQGLSDLMTSLLSAVASLGSGFVFASFGYAVMGVAGACASLIPLFLTAWWWGRQRRLAMLAS